MRSMLCADRRRRGLTLVELLLVGAVVGALAALAMPTYHGYRERVDSAAAATHIRGFGIPINAFRAEFGDYPNAMALAINEVIPNDPWGNPYAYLRIDGAPPSTRGRARKDKNLVPINSDYDLYSSGPDGRTTPPLTAKHSHDDVVRANDGTYIGIAEKY